MHVVGCCKQPVKHETLSIALLFEDIGTFLTSGLFVLIHLHSSRLPAQFDACELVSYFIIFSLPTSKKTFLSIQIHLFPTNKI